MSSVSSVTSNDYLNSLLNSTEETTEETDDGSTISQDEFLEILMVQLQYQDPLDPMDSEQFTSQLTDFSMLEQQIETNSHLTEMSEAIGTSVQYGLVDYIGKEVVTTSNVISVSDDMITDVNVTLAETGNVQMVIYNSSGEEIIRIDYGELSAGTHEITWDGKDDSGNSVDNGEYIYLVSATDENGASLDVATAEYGEVTGIYYEEGTPYLVVGGNTVSLDSITEISG